MNHVIQHPLAQPGGVPTAHFKLELLNSVYEPFGFKVLEGYSFLAAQHTTTKVGIFVVDGDFGHEQFKIAIADGKSAGIDTRRMYVYARSASYTSRMICFCKLEDVGL